MPPGILLADVPTSAEVLVDGADLTISPLPESAASGLSLAPVAVLLPPL